MVSHFVGKNVGFVNNYHRNSAITPFCTKKKNKFKFVISDPKNRKFEHYLYILPAFWNSVPGFVVHYDEEVR